MVKVQLSSGVNPRVPRFSLVHLAAHTEREKKRWVCIGQGTRVKENQSFKKKRNSGQLGKRDIKP